MKLATLFIFFAWSLPSMGQMCSAYPKSSDQVDQLSKVAIQINKQTNIQYTENEIGDFCHRNMLLRYLNNKKKAPVDCVSWPIEKLEAEVDKINSQTRLITNDSSPWQLTLISTEKSKKRQWM